MRFSKINVLISIFTLACLAMLFGAGKKAIQYIEQIPEVSVNKTEVFSEDIEYSKSRSEEKNIRAASVMPNPLLSLADEIEICPNNGLELAKFNLCGTGDTRTIATGLATSTISWQLLDETSCAGITLADVCPNTNLACTWNTVSTGPDFTISTAGQYRVRIITNGMLELYYFNVSSNPLDPQTISTDLICGNNGSIEVTNIPADYEYSLNNPGGPYQLSPIFDITTPGTYTVYVRQQGVGPTACVFPTQPIDIQQLDIDVNITPTDIVCSGDFGAIDIQVNNVPGFYNYSLSLSGTVIDTFGPTNDSSYTFDNLNGGTYEIEVTTDDGCTDSATVTIATISDIDLTAFATESFGCGSTSVDITANASGGIAPYQYSVDGGALQPSNILTVNTPGDHTILVEDANGCQEDITYNVPNILPPDFAITANDSNCAGANDGQILINIIDSRGYQLSFSNDNGTTFQNATDFLDLAPSNYDVIIRYESGPFSCDIPQSVTVNSASTISASAQINTIYDCNNRAEIEIINVTGGTPPYNYSIGGGFGTNPVFGNLTDGAYTPRVRDDNGCVFVVSPPVVIDPINEITDITFAIVATDCANAEVDIQLTAINGSGNYEYAITAPAAQATAPGPADTFNDLSLGSYTFEITDTTTGCTFTKSYAVNDISSIIVQGQRLNDVSCATDTNGAIRFTINNFSTNYNYSIDTSPVQSANNQTANTIDFTGLPAGTYTITVTDNATSCVETASVEVRAPSSPLSLALDVTPKSCSNGNEGRVRGNASDGWGSYQYRLIQPDATSIPGSGFRNNRNFTGLTQNGTYTLEVRDGNGCVVPQTFTLNDVVSPTLSIDTAGSNFCYDVVTGATIAVQATGGTAPLEYRINGGTRQASPVFTGLNPGSYTIDVIDANNCEDTITATIESPITAVAFISLDQGCPMTAAEITVDIDNGYPPYGNIEVSINGGPYNPIGTPTGSVFVYTTTVNTGPTADTYQFRVNDGAANGCPPVITNEVVIDPIPIPVDTSTPTDTSCGSANGSIQLSADPNTGVPPFTYDFGNTGTFITQSLYSNLAVGSYDYTIRDANGCEVTGSLSINISTSFSATTIATDETCAGSGTVQGSITVNTTGGAAPFTYELFNTITGASTGQTNNTGIFNVDSGLYYVVVTDDNGCRVITTPDFIDDSSEVTLAYAPPSPITCSPTGTAYEVTIVGGGTGPLPGCFQIGLAGGPLGPPNALPAPSGGACERNHSFAGVIGLGGSYTVEILDETTGCTYFETITVPEPTTLRITATPTVTPACAGVASGSVSYTITGYTGTDLSVVIVNTDDGTTYGPIPYTGLTGADVNDSFGGLPAGNYDIRVTETDPLSTLCSDGDGFTIAPNPPLSLRELNNVNASCSGDSQVSVEGLGGTAPYEFQFIPDATPGTNGSTTPVPADYSNDNTSTSTANFNEATSPTWEVWVRDANGCEESIEITIATDPAVVIDNVATLNPCSPVGGTYDIQINLVANGAIGPFEFSVARQGSTGSPFQTSPIFSGLTPGNYTASVRDGNGCPDTFDLEIFEPLDIRARFRISPTCNDNDGQIRVRVTGGSGNFEYRLYAGFNNTTPPLATQNTRDFSGYGPGDYFIEVEDLDTGCPVVTDQLSLNTRNIPVIDSLNKIDVSCNGQNDGSFSVDVSNTGGGAQPISYYIFSGTVTLPLPLGTEISSQNNRDFGNLAPGTYSVGVVTSQGCEAVLSETIIDPSAIELSSNFTPFTCNPLANTFSTATITLYPNSIQSTNVADNTGTAPYIFSIDGANYQNDPVFTIVDNGSTQSFPIVYIRDANGCETTQTANISLAPTSTLTITVATQDPGSCRTGTETVRVTASGGVGPYEFELLPNGSGTIVTDPSFADFVLSAPGDYLFSVSDLGTGGCRQISPSYTFNIYDTIQASISNATSVCYEDGDSAPQNTGTVQLDVTGHIGSYSYTAYLQNGTPVSPAVTGTGTAGTPLTVAGLPGENIYIEIDTDVVNAAPYCPATTNTLTIPAPSDPLVATAAETANVTCTNNLGVIVASADGGWGSYQYRIENTATATLVQDFDPNNVFSGLSEGSHLITVRDAEGCTDTFTIVLNQPVAITGEIELVQGLLCPGDNDAAIRIDTTLGGGEGSYIFRLNLLDTSNAIISTSGPQATPQFNNLPAGNYSITIRDGWECSYTTLPFNIPDPSETQAILRESVPADCIDPAELEIRIINAIPLVEYEYLISTDDPITGTWTSMGPGVSSITFTEPATNTSIDRIYRYYVRQVGSAACPVSLSNQVRADPVPPLDVAPDLSDIDLKCTGEATAIIRAQATGGVGDYRYRLYNADTNTPIGAEQSSGIFRNLGAGNYYVFASSRGCSDQTATIPIIDPVPLTAPNPIVTNVSCFGGDDGSITVQASGGTGSIQFAISNRLNEFFDEQTPNTNTFTFNDLEAGTYDIIIQDSVGCFETYSIPVGEPDRIAATSSTIPESCLGDDDGVINVQINGGTSPYFTTMDPNDPLSYIQDQFRFENLQGNQSYVIYIRDANDCEQTIAVDLGVGVNLNPTLDIRYECPGTQLMNEVEVGIGEISQNDVVYILDNGSTTDNPVFRQLSEGDHTIEVLHRNGCSRMLDFSIDTADPVSVSLIETANNVLTATAMGGVPPYTYFVNGENVSDDNVIIVPENGLYEVRVVDSNGCEATDQIDYLFIDIEIPNFFSPNGDGQNDFWAPINQVSFPNIESEIYDRYGRLLKTLKQNEKWDGRYERNMKPLPSGDYWYVIRLKDFDNREFTGHFTLLR